MLDLDYNEMLDEIRGQKQNSPPQTGGLDIDFNALLDEIRGDGQDFTLNEAQRALIQDVDEREAGPARETFDPLSLSDWGNKVAAPLGIAAGRMVTDTTLGGGGFVLGKLGMDSAAQWLLDKNVDASDWWNDLNMRTAGENPHFISDVASGLGSSAGFMLMGGGAMRAAKGLGRMGQLAAGALTEGGMEALAETGGVMTDAYAQGKYQEGLDVAGKDFLTNAGLSMLLNLAGGRYNPYLDKIPGFSGWLARTAAEVGEEALLQEPLQGVIESAANKTLANGKDFTENLLASLQEYPDILAQVGPSSAASTALLQAMFGVAGGIQRQTQVTPEQTAADVVQRAQDTQSAQINEAQRQTQPKIEIDYNRELDAIRAAKAEGPEAAIEAEQISPETEQAPIEAEQVTHEAERIIPETEQVNLDAEAVREAELRRQEREQKEQERGMVKEHFRRKILNLQHKQYDEAAADANAELAMRMTENLSRISGVGVGRVARNIMGELAGQSDASRVLAEGKAAQGQSERYSGPAEMSDVAKEKLAADEKTWSDSIDKVLDGTIKQGTHIKVMTTPLALNLVGAKILPVYMDASKISKSLKIIRK